ncbi:[Pyruvate dehydrogenase [acetyl-transferring]]-phosphatase 1, mitochondrial [Coemansia thaxteri]|uniref:[Pyruvate dehydrogenase [acetyl-transferring]]-phosphatase 1, mitochondrial n=1 Tax=Coemansia thaxteri TaxID=2663907 RepID=A0A9W8BDE3_9FUNG|nr:[Pyruvate dehydrogenase [acetyl-transferring]]-phosphatase 1, mitochondrial [Coemansia thaxteri]KAJ2009431.1 [Pyruvate dehydrogenase [acetyl-transferring]]-phosphatase 1, mitochondrial [Coemansia thaxteri]KAJ2473956.1 [Pyruvate dehydrogenase [acetyl-transferring]]-phosphatase 1, mitochondrial [Coemansia sp. RSA 2322]KAJ2478173.1 [Pyruvate dehydrogenase [acetyl-transferring]]-phosphatase 1, mitochondrial [Coemansia sp. RSA 2320]
MFAQYSARMLATAINRSPALTQQRLPSSFGRLTASAYKPQPAAGQMFSSSRLVAKQPSNKCQGSANPTGNNAYKSSYASFGKLSLAFATGGSLALAGYALATRQDSTGSKTTPAETNAVVHPPVDEVFKSVAKKHNESRALLDGVPREKRNNAAKQLAQLTDEEVNTVLRAKEKSWCLKPKPDGSKIRVDTNQIPSNSRIEDYLTFAALGSSDGAASLSNTGRYMFGVFDGHAGHQCAEHVSSRMGSVLEESLNAVAQLAEIRSGDIGAALISPTASESVFATVAQIASEVGPSWGQVPLALTAAFVNLDEEIVNGAVEKYRSLQEQNQQVDIAKLLGPGVAGSCGLVAVVDTEAKQVVVANTGDSGALIGVRLDSGAWKAVRLSHDQTMANPDELIRMIREHPGEKDIALEGRVLGGLMPTRAFGDSRYKLPAEVQKELFPLLLPLGFSYATSPTRLKRPPYVTACPVVITHKLSANDKFLVLATDGLYDQLDDDEIVNTVAQWYETHGSKTSTNSSTPTTRDSNAATHLIRAAFSVDWNGSKGDETTRRMLAIPSPVSRSYRDDISVTVVTLDDN